MAGVARVTEVEYLGEYRLRVTFSDALVRELSFGDALIGPVFDALRDRGLFARVFVDEVEGTVAWPNGVDLDPDVLHGDYEPATGPSPDTLAEYHLRPTG